MKFMFHSFLAKIEPRLIKIYRRLAEPPAPNLRGDREIEWSFVAANLGSGLGKALDFGCGQGYLGLMAAQAGFETVAVDLTSVTWYYQHPYLSFLQGDLLSLQFPEKSFDLIINCSSVEHSGLIGRYGVEKEGADDDLEVMRKMRRLLKPNGRMLLTVPVNRDKVFYPLHRVYGEERLPRLLEDFIIEKEEYWTKNKENQWVLTDKMIALRQEPKTTLYGLGCFVLTAKV